MNASDLSADLPTDPATDASEDTGRDTLRLVFWNTYLLQPRPIPGGPGLPAIGELAAPAVADRAHAIGAALRGRFDVAALAEAFEPVDRRRLLSSWGSPTITTAAGPGRSLLRGPLGFASSGLFTVADGPRIIREMSHQFTERGSYRHDADALANKGVLLAEVELAGRAANLEVYSTHLCWGTGLLGGPVAEDPIRRHRVRMAQVDELVRFVRRSHRPGNVAIIVGDMNVPALAPDFPDGPTAQYDDLVERLATVGVHDLWPRAGVGAGHTCGANTDEFADQVDPDDPDALVDTDGADAGVPVDPALAAQRERIDYVFLQDPDRRHRVRVEATGVRRYAFPRAAHAPDRDRLVRLSDHLAIGVDLAISDP